MPSTDAMLYYGINIAHDEDGDYPAKFEELEGEGPDFFSWLESRVKEYNEKHSFGEKLEAAFHCCTNCSGYYVTLGSGYQYRAWRGEPQKLDFPLPEVSDVMRNHLIELALSMGVDDPSLKMGWWLASYAEM